MPSIETIFCDKCGRNMTESEPIETQEKTFGSPHYWKGNTNALYIPIEYENDTHRTRVIYIRVDNMYLCKTCFFDALKEFIRINTKSKKQKKKKI